MTRHNAGAVTYDGDVSHMAGEIKGPTTYGSYVVATAADYDPARDKTRVTFAHLGPANEIHLEDGEQLEQDEHGQSRIVTAAGAA